MRLYKHQNIERKWFRRWQATAKAASGRGRDFDSRPKFYCLVEFPYPSGDGLHVGHLRPYTALDIVARKRRLEGQNVLYPFGFDAFGLPAENYAIKTGTNPAVITKRNIANFTRQLNRVGFSFDWDRAVTTTDPKYYRWTQWIFLKLYEHGLAYRAEIPINWCPKDKIGLANEEVVNGACERCGTAVEQRTKAQWLLRITKYADRLIDDLTQVNYPQRVKAQQVNWIGRSQGAKIQFQIQQATQTIEVFTTRPDTIFGATFLVVAPEHPVVTQLEGNITNLEAVRAYVEAAKQKTDVQRSAADREKTGVPLEGVMATNPATGKAIAVWVADYVMLSYGTGAIMAVPAHDERDFAFAQKHHLPIIQVVSSTGQPTALDAAYVDTHSGQLLNSGTFSGQSVSAAIPAITQWLASRGQGQAAVSYKLRDWVFSRQRYWGEPIPLVYCTNCIPRGDRAGVDYVEIDGVKHTVVAIPDDQLPVKLPKVTKYQPTDTGESPLSSVARWVNTKCPRCKGKARRETDVMPNWAGSNWYFLRYCDPHNDRALADPKKLSYWMPVDWYNGGMEHTTLHLLYSRFIYKFLWDIGAVPKSCGSEPYRKRTSHGLILAEGGEKMSKSRGNVVNPDTVVEQYGADVLRVYEMFIGPFEQHAAWDTKGIIGIRRFLERVWALGKTVGPGAKAMDPALEQQLHASIGKISADIESLRFNTAVSALMVLANTLADQPVVDRAAYSTFLILLAPFAPHLAEECWARIGNKNSVFSATWPKADSTKAKASEVTVVVQVNGRVRASLRLPAGANEETAVAAARQEANVLRHLEGQTVARVVYISDRLLNFVLTT